MSVWEDANEYCLVLWPRTTLLQKPSWHGGAVATKFSLDGNAMVSLDAIAKRQCYPTLGKERACVWGAGAREPRNHAM
jgi:hypothetical protein